MTAVRILVTQDSVDRRLLAIKTTADGSLLMIPERPKLPVGGVAIYKDGTWAAADLEGDDRSGDLLRLTVHTTGQVNLHGRGLEKSRLFLDPLTRMSKWYPLGVISVPNFAYLDAHEGIAKEEVSAHLILASEIKDRLTFHIEIGPVPAPNDLEGLLCIFDTFCIRIFPAQDIDVAHQENAYVFGMWSGIGYDSIQMHPAEAELSFIQRIDGERFYVDRSGDGRYTLYTPRVMVWAPRIRMEFTREDLHMEIDHARPADPVERNDFERRLPRHKVRFWICDRSGRIKNEDLRPFIKDIVAEAFL